MTLSTTTDGATIRYTLDDTCPCTEEALTYHNPIAITEATVLRAAAVLDGTYSTTIRLELNVSTTSPDTPISTYTITASAGTGGSINPDGIVTVAQGESRTFTITPYSSFRVSDVKVDGVSVGAVSSYTFDHVTANHTIAASFRYVGSGSGGYSGSGSYPVIVGSASHGTVAASPSSAFKGTTVTLAITPDDGYELSGLIVMDASGSEVKLTKVSGIEYAFTMPSGKVTVTPTFVKTTDSTPAIANPFVDISASTYYYDAVLWAAKSGITMGTGATTFSPDASCTRAQMVTFLWRTAGSPGSHQHRQSLHGCEQRHLLL